MPDFQHISSESFFNREFASEFYADKTRPILIGVDLRNPANIGGLIRLGGNIGASRIILVNDNQQFNHKKIRHAASNAYNSVETIFALPDQWKELIPSNYQLIAIETATKATNIYTTKLPKNIAFIVGSEASGIPNSILANCFQAVYIPTFGHTLSLNVVQAAAIASYEWLRQQSF